MPEEFLRSTSGPNSGEYTCPKERLIDSEIFDQNIDAIDKKNSAFFDQKHVKHACCYSFLVLDFRIKLHSKVRDNVTMWVVGYIY